MTAEKISPHEELGEDYRWILLGYLDSMKAQAAPGDWTATPEVVRTGARTQYIVPWGARPERVSYCFSFVTRDSRWYFQHLETIFVRLDTIAALPASRFPDIPEAQKQWAREEISWSFIVLNFYLTAAAEKGKDRARELLRDGGGYYVGAKTWVPFAEPHRAFILYLCWEQANLRGNDVTLVKLDDEEAVVRMKTHFFTLYFTAAHLKGRISLEEYRGIFETIWQDRASKAGWNLAIEYAQDYAVTFHFRRR